MIVGMAGGTEYAKRPRGPGHDRAVAILENIEDGIYLVAGLVLLVAAVLLLWSVIAKLSSDLTSPNPDPLMIVFNVLDRGLVLLILGELLHTVRVSVRERTLAAEPFLIVAIIAGIRRILIITAQAAQGTTKFAWSTQGLELLLLTGLVLVMTVAVILWRRYYIPLLSSDA